MKINLHLSPSPPLGVRRKRQTSSTIMRHRIFIAINLPEDIKKQLSIYQSKWPELPCRWTRKENLHITLVFLGYVKDEELPEILKAVKETASRNQPFKLTLKRITYGPSEKPPRPPKFLDKISYDEPRAQVQKFRRARMVWAEGEKSQELGNLQIGLEKAVLESFTSYPRLNFKETLAGGSGRPYAPHINLGRLKIWEFKAIEPEERPEIEESISLSFEVNSIEIMESRLKPKGPDYFVLESLLLGVEEDKLSSSPFAAARVKK